MAEAEDRRVGALVRKNEITQDNLDAAVRSYLEREAPGPIALGERYTLDVAAAVQAHRNARDVLADPGAPTGLRRTMVLTAIIAATPDKA